MSRTAFVPLLVLASLLVAGDALAQTDLKPRPNSQPAPVVSHQPGRAAADRERVTARVAVGERAPDFELDQLDGKPLRLSRLRGDWVMLFFVERRESLDVVEPVAHALGAKGVRTLAVCFDKGYVLAHHLAGRELSFVPLADPTGDILALYGLLDGDVPQPGFVLINPRGEVRLAMLGHGLPSADASRMVQYSLGGD
ncbi:MAG TPA: redoxin domain-containing protein [Candidatus Eisenbacteria bacterium]|jgi:peroxiredoxin